MNEICVIDNFLRRPEEYRAQALQQEYKAYPFSAEEVFRGIAISGTGDGRLMLECRIPTFGLYRWPHFDIYSTFFRRSPLHQPEPNFIHTDVDMGTCSAILYLNPDPPAGDGTTFWMHAATGEIGNPEPHLRSREGQTPEGWIVRKQVEAKFNRLVLWRSDLYHSRSLKENWGDEKEARLVQIFFGKGNF